MRGLVLLTVLVCFTVSAFAADGDVKIFSFNITCESANVVLCSWTANDTKTFEITDAVSGNVYLFDGKNDKVCKEKDGKHMCATSIFMELTQSEVKNALYIGEETDNVIAYPPDCLPKKAKSFTVEASCLSLNASFEVEEGSPAPTHAAIDCSGMSRVFVNMTDMEKSYSVEIPTVPGEYECSIQMGTASGRSDPFPTNPKTVKIAAPGIIAWKATGGPLKIDASAKAVKIAGNFVMDQVENWKIEVISSDSAKIFSKECNNDTKNCEIAGLEDASRYIALYQPIPKTCVNYSSIEWSEPVAVVTPCVMPQIKNIEEVKAEDPLKISVSELPEYFLPGEIVCKFENEEIVPTISADRKIISCKPSNVGKNPKTIQLVGSLRNGAKCSNTKLTYESPSSSSGGGSKPSGGSTTTGSSEDAFGILNSFTFVILAISIPILFIAVLVGVFYYYVKRSGREFSLNTLYETLGSFGGGFLGESSSHSSAGAAGVSSQVVPAVTFPTTHTVSINDDVPQMTDSSSDPLISYELREEEEGQSHQVRGMSLGARRMIPREPEPEGTFVDMPFDVDDVDVEQM